MGRVLKVSPRSGPTVNQLPNTDPLGAGLLLDYCQFSHFFLLAHECLILSETLLPLYSFRRHRHGMLFYHKAA